MAGLQLNDILGTIGSGLMSSGAKSVKGSASSLSSSTQAWSALIDVAINFGVSYLTAKGEGRKNEKLLRQMAELDAQSAEKLKGLISASVNELAKTQVIIEFLNAENIKKLEAERKKKRIIGLAVLGFGAVLLGLIFYKLHKQNGQGN
jgi:hypothetical protein